MAQADPAPSALAFRAINRAGHGVIGKGRQDEDAATLTQRLYDQHVRSAVVCNEAGEQVGGVGRSDSGDYVWWGEGGGDHA